MHSTRIKICGITRTVDALHAAQLGADAIGLIFYQQSPRYVGVQQARAIVEALPPFVTTVGVFVDATAETIKNVLQAVPLDRLQFHGQEEPATCAHYGKPYIKAVRVKSTTDIIAAVKRYSTASAILLDTYQADAVGGTGATFDWQLIPADLDKAIILAGGLNTANVNTAIRAVRPYAVDVVSGVESAPGIKDLAKLESFIREVRGA